MRIEKRAENERIEKLMLPLVQKVREALPGRALAFARAEFKSYGEAQRASKALAVKANGTRVAEQALDELLRLATEASTKAPKKHKEPRPGEVKEQPRSFNIKDRLLGRWNGWHDEFHRQGPEMFQGAIDVLVNELRPRGGSGSGYYPLAPGPEPTVKGVDWEEALVEHERQAIGSPQDVLKAVTHSRFGLTWTDNTYDRTVQLFSVPVLRRPIQTLSNGETKKGDWESAPPAVVPVTVPPSLGTRLANVARAVGNFIAAPFRALGSLFW
jgi:hypothetical protein